ncbi:hypothetical protein RVIR1_09450 [Candidatus Rickettsiella viridis]|uniref:Uncharacterized protein n=1 Tax=Candidatus Rickettsiella viridis TaxID=676208 RepID=A0A2Z5UWN9_9COXI|nr:hypothetical protein [Candidatus Rickettsiella viridis]BBB15423.1 hypothetical protein RVIR1_09450 [Candidatus Rickettsiella viridis]
MDNVINKEILLTQEFAGQIRNKVNQEKIPLQAGYEYHIAKGFLDLLIKLKKELKNSSCFPFENNKTNWTPEIEEKIFILYQQLKKLFSPIEGGCRPDNQSAYWSSDGRKAAEKIGIDFAHTVIGSVVNQMMPKIQMVITHNKKTNEKIESTFNFIIWSALSKLYIEETTNDAYVFLADGEIHCQSIFWNIELHALREKQHSGNIQHLFLYTLQPHAMQHYQHLLKIRNTSQSSLSENLGIQTEIDTIVTNNNNWHCELLDNSSLFKIRTKKNKAITFQSLKSYASAFYKNNPSIHASTVINNLKKKKYSDKILSAAIKIINLNDFNKKTNNYIVIIANYRNIEQLKLVFNEKAREYKKNTGAC